jgi:hypothetical protein
MPCTSMINQLFQMRGTGTHVDETILIHEFELYPALAEWSRALT